MEIERYHSLDKLRASMMLLGIVLHTGISYVQQGVPVWHFQDQDRNAFFDWLLMFIHQFRMPLFFVLAGFFAALLIDKKGIKSTLSNRFQRIGLPFILFWIPLFPLCHYGFQFANFHEIRLSDFSPSVPANKMLEPQGLPTLHLWFLYYLLMYYTMVGIIFLIQKYIPTLQNTKALHAAFRQVLASPWRWFLYIPILALLLYPMQSGTYDTAVSFIPNPWVLMVYAVFFFFGYATFFQRDLLHIFKKQYAIKLFLGLVLSLVYGWAIIEFKQGAGQGSWQHWLAVFAGASMTWVLIWGFMGLFLSLFDRFSAWAKYLSEASYWVYLIHLPIVIWLGAWLGMYRFSPFAKFALVLMIAVPLCLLSYHFLARKGIIARLLNGKQPSGITTQKEKMVLQPEEQLQG